MPKRKDAKHGLSEPHYQLILSTLASIPDMDDVLRALAVKMDISRAQIEAIATEQQVRAQEKAVFDAAQLESRKPKKYKKVVEALHQKASPSHIASLTGLSRKNITLVAHHIGADITKPALWRDPAKRAAVIAALGKTPNVLDVAQQTGVSRPTIYQIAAEIGMDLKRGKKAGNRFLSDKEIDVIASRLRQHPNPTEVSRQMGIGHDTAKRVAAKRKIEVKLSRPQSKPKGRLVARPRMR